jgi:AMIN domain
MWARKQCGILLLLASCAAAQGTAPRAVSVQDLRVVRDTSNNLRVEITLSAPLGSTPSATAATSPNRVVLDLPNTLSDGKQQQLAVNYKGVRRVRLGLNSATPPITRVMVEMDEAHPYDLQSDGTRVTLIIGAAPNAIASSGQGAQAAGKSGGLVGVFRRRPAAPPMESGNESATGLPPPPPQLPPINFPEEQSGNAANTSSASVSSHPTSSHPDRGSLQEGTVFPGMGSPETGNVPTAQSSNANTSSGTVPTTGPPQSGGAEKKPSGFGASIATDTGFPSVVVTPVPSSNTETASRPIPTVAPQPTPEALSQVSQSRTSPVSTATPTVEPPPQPKIEASATGSQGPAVTVLSSSPDQPATQNGSAIAAAQALRQNATAPANEKSVATPAPQPTLEALSSISRAEPGPLGISTPAVQPPAQPRTEVSAPGSQGIVPATLSPSTDQAEARQSLPISTGEAKPQSATQSVPQNETPSSEVASETPASAKAPLVAAVEPAPVTASAAPDNNAAITPEAATDNATTDVNLPVLALRSLDPNLRTVFKVKYVAEGVAYLDGGRTSGLAEGMKLEIRDSDLPSQEGATVDPTDPRVVAELEVSATAETSAVTDIHLPKRQVKPGDLAYLSSGDAQTLVQQRSLSATRKYPAVVTFTEGDPLEEEARAEVPRPPQPSVNRARGRIGFDYMGTVSRGSSSATSSDLGMVLRADITRLNGTYWNISGYWRGRLSARSSTSQQTLQDLINRTYHLSMTYDNPNSPWVAGFGRLYLPWAPSLDTIDGGYFGRRLSPGVTAGIFAGSTPDPTSWDYSLDRRIGGAFINFQAGDFDAFHYTSTTGIGVSTLKWKIDRPFVFLENTVSYKRYLSIYHSLQADSPAGNPAVPAPGPGLSRSFLTLRIQPHPRLEIDFNHNYFRDVPTFDPQLIGTGLLDKYLFQGFSAGARVEVVKQIFVYGTLGQTNRSGDTKSSLNQMYGITFGHLPWMGLRADAHYSRFNSSFGSGSYRAFSLSRNFTDDIRLEVLAFVNANVDFAIGEHYFAQGGFTINRGQLSYDQWMFTLGYRFDTKGKHHQ